VNILRTLVVIGATGLVTVMLPAFSAQAASSQNDIVIVSDKGMTVTIPNPNKKTKDSPQRSVRPLGGAVCGIGNSSCSFSLSAYEEKYITPSGGSQSRILSQGTTNVVMYIVPLVAATKADFYNTNSLAFWGGANPFNCTSVKSTDIWDIDYVAAGWGYGGNVSVNLNFGSGRIGYENSYGPTYQIAHYGDHVYLSVSGGTIDTVKYEAHGVFQFGGQFFDTDAYVSDFIWG